MEERVRVPWEEWRLVKSLGKGGFGEVWEIERVKHGITEKAAMKVISIPQGDDEIECLQIEGYSDESITQRFSGFVDDVVREYGMMVQMKGNANIVYCDDYKSIQHDDGFGWDIYIKMELLTPMMKALKLVSTEQQIIQFAKDICSALVVCQKRKVIHRDIKPQNIFVSEDGVFKLGDFGIARTAERTTRATVGKGTYQFMAPEVKNDQPYGATADIYSLGLVLHWLLNERRSPFLPLPPEAPKHGDEERAKQRRFSGEQIPAPKNGSKELQKIVLKACAFDPKQRYQSAAEMLADLQALESGFVPVFVPKTNEVEIVSNTDDEKTVGPDFGKQDSETELDAEKTVGPQLDKGEQADELDNEKTVGPIFEAEDKPKQPEKKKNFWPIIAVLLMITALGSVFAFSRAVVVSVALDQKVLENHLLDGYSAIGYYDVNTKLPIGSTSKVAIEVGEIYNNHTVLITGDTVEQPIVATVIGGKVSVELNPKGSYLLQVENDTTNDANWSGWETKLPDDISVNSNTVEADIMYRTRQKEYTTSGTDTLDGWVFYESFTPEQPYGEWSEWTETKLTGDEYLEVEKKHLYRYREQEFKTSESSTMAGWTLYDSQENYSYGEWESSYTPVSPGDSMEVFTAMEYGYLYDVYHDGTFLYTDWVGHLVNDGDDYTPVQIGGTVGTIYDSETGYTYTTVVTRVDTPRKYYWYRTKTLSSTTYYYSRWTDWSDWGTKAVSETDTVKVETKTLYRSREIYGDVIYRFWRWSDWIDWTLQKPEETDEVDVESRMVYRYKQ